MIPTFNLPQPRFGLIGHRGAAAICPENTLISMQTAHQHLDWIECDVQLTNDGHLVIFHDESIKRTSNGGDQLLHQHALEHLSQYDYGSWFDSRFSKTPLLTLEDLWRYANDAMLHMNLELKPYANATSLALKFSEFLNTHVRNFHLLISSFDHQILYEIRKTNPDIAIGFLVEEHDPLLFDQLLRLENCSYHLSVKQNSLSLFESLSRYEVPILTYTVNDADLAESLLQSGVWGIFTDKPDLYRRYFEMQA
jgi:glycerophosphoryl diester phosphodiesterase